MRAETGWWRQKPVVIEAYQTGQDYDQDCAIVAWAGARAVGPEDGHDEAIMVIDSPGGALAVTPGDWVVKDAKGEFYPCKPDIFEATHEPIS